MFNKERTENETLIHIYLLTIRRGGPALNHGSGGLLSPAARTSWDAGCASGRNV